MDYPNCVCKMGPQTSDHLLWECELLRQQREVLKNSITKTGGDWPLTNSDLANKHTKLFQMFVNSINFETLWLLTLRLLMSYIYIYIYMEHLFLMFLDHTQRRSTVGRTPLDE